MTLRFVRILSDRICRSYTDRRRNVRKIVAEYAGDDNELYRKAFEAMPPQKPVMPLAGDHDSLNDVKLQWTTEGRRMLIYAGGTTLNKGGA